MAIIYHPILWRYHIQPNGVIWRDERQYRVAIILERMAQNLAERNCFDEALKIAFWLPHPWIQRILCENISQVSRDFNNDISQLICQTIRVLGTQQSFDAAMDLVDTVPDLTHRYAAVQDLSVELVKKNLLKRALDMVEMKVAANHIFDRDSAFSCISVSLIEQHDYVNAIETSQKVYFSNARRELLLKIFSKISTEMDLELTEKIGNDADRMAVRETLSVQKKRDFIDPSTTCDGKDRENSTPPAVRIPAPWQQPLETAREIEQTEQKKTSEILETTAASLAAKKCFVLALKAAHWIPNLAIQKILYDNISLHYQDFNQRISQMICETINKLGEELYFTPAFDLIDTVPDLMQRYCVVRDIALKLIYQGLLNQALDIIEIKIGADHIFYRNSAFSRISLALSMQHDYERAIWVAHKVSCRDNQRKDLLLQIFSKILIHKTYLETFEFTHKIIDQSDRRAVLEHIQALK